MATQGSGISLRLATSALEILERQSSRRSWPLLVLVTATAISFFCWLPNYQVFADFIHTPYGAAKSWWLNHPFQAVPVEQFFPPSEWSHGYNAGIASHLDKLTFRALLPLLNQIAPFGIWTVVAASHLAGFVLLWLTYKIVASQTRDKVSAALTTWALAACYAGQYGFQDHYLGDGVAISLLVAAMAARKSFPIGLFIFGACLTDERAVFSTPLVLIFHLLRIPTNQGLINPDPGDRASHAKDISPWRTLRAAMAPLACGLGAYILLRQTITLFTGAETGTSMLFARSIIRTNLYDAYPARVFKVFEFLWVILLAFLIESSQRFITRRSLRWLLICSLVVASFPAYMVIDLDRSLLYLMPAVITASCFLPMAQQARRLILLCVAVANAVWIYPSFSALRLLATLTPG